MVVNKKLRFMKGNEKCCTARCTSVEYECLNPSGFFLLFSSRLNCDLCPMNDKRLLCFLFFFVSCVSELFFCAVFFLIIIIVFYFASMGQILFFMTWWNINTWKCETAESLASGCVWMSIGWGSALDFSPLVLIFFFLSLLFHFADTFQIVCF